MEKLEKRPLVFAIIAFAVGACSGPPAGQNTQQEPMVFHTWAAETIEANRGTQEAWQSLATSVYQTVIAEITQTAIVEDARKPVHSQTPEFPSPSPSSSPLPSPILSPLDPHGELGKATWQDPFDNAYNWYIYKDGVTKTAVKDGQFQMTIFRPQQASQWTLSWPKIQDFFLEAEARTPETCSGKDRYGLVFRAPNVNQVYNFAVSCDGAYRLAKWDGIEFTILVDWTHTSSIIAGAAQTNKLGVMANGDRLALFVNGDLLAEITDDAYLEAGRFGFLIGSENTADFSVRFDNVAYWQLP